MQMMNVVRNTKHLTIIMFVSFDSVLDGFHNSKHFSGTNVNMIPIKLTAHPKIIFKDLYIS